ncbi:hypothetical protein DC522_31355 [Microvirga sp. KLBC 81]|nr:hypothetical protein DC522_31355 [Microvirga sp. KLBC 81]
MILWMGQPPDKILNAFITISSYPPIRSISVVGPSLFARFPTDAYMITFEGFPPNITSSTLF